MYENKPPRDDPNLRPVGQKVDKHRLPVDQRYQEWDVNPAVPGRARDAERLVTSNDGVAYYSNDHYQNFTRLR